MGGLLDLLAVLLHAVLERLLRALGGLLGDLLAVLERLLAGLLGRLDHLVGELAELLVLDARGRDQQARDEPDGDGAQRQPDRILLGQPLGLTRLAVDLLAVGGRVGHGVLGAHELLPDIARGSHDALLGRITGVLQRFLRARLHVGLVAERVDGALHLRPRPLYLGADPVWVFAHRMSSFTVSTVWGAGGVACCNAFWPALASTRATIAHSAITISAATHVAIALSSSAISPGVSA